MKSDWLIQTNMEGVDTGPMMAEVLHRVCKSEE